MSINSVEISILVTFYNQVNNVERAVNSILQQKRSFNIEILISDDGSTDGTWEKLENLKKENPTIIKIFKQDRGNGVLLGGFRASRSRLFLLEQSKGKYIAFLDGDDYYIDMDKLEKQYRILENKDNQDCIACAHDISYVYEDGSIKHYYGNKIKEGKYNKHEYWRKMYFHTNTIMVRSSYKNNLPYNLLKNEFNDNVITFFILECGMIYYLSSPMASYVQTGNGIWTGQKEIINLLRNIFICDLIENYDKSMTKDTDIRFRCSWINMLKKRNQIENAINDELKTEAINNSFIYSQYWCNYKSLSILKKMHLLLKILVVEIRYRIYLLHK